jgi:hypothetical protein
MARPSASAASGRAGRAAAAGGAPSPAPGSWRRGRSRPRPASSAARCIRPPAGRGHQRGDTGAARLAQQQRGLRVDVDEDDLHRCHVGLVARHHFAHTPSNSTLRRAGQVALVAMPGADGAAGHVAQRGPRRRSRQSRWCAGRGRCQEFACYTTFIAACALMDGGLVLKENFVLGIEVKIPAHRVKKHRRGKTQRIHPVQQAAGAGDRHPACPSWECRGRA